MVCKRTLAAVVGVAVVACTSTSEPDLSAACTVPVTIQVGAGAQPTVSWTPVCAATSVTVSDPGAVGALPIWYIQAAPQLISTPIRYGSSPEGATGFLTADSLMIGRSYTIYVERGLRGDIHSGIDSLTFFAH
jgi:hypothetical protein